MSGAAHDCVRACTHPKVKGGTRDLFDAIAHFVPEGETTTPAVSMEALAHYARLHRRTVVKRLADLVEIGVVKVIDGGVGRIARYTVVHVDGAPPIVAQPLPLRADLQPVPRRPATPDDTTGDLFDPMPTVRSDNEEPVIEPVLIDHRLPVNLWRSITGWFLYLWRSITGWRSEGEKPVLIDHRLASNGDEPVIATCDPALPLDVDDARARDVQQLKRTTTTAAMSGDAPKVKRLPCRWAGTTHAWCDGRVHVPKAFHIEERRKLARQPEDTDADLDARLFARYAEILAEIPDAEEIPDRNEFVFWKRVLRSATPNARVPIQRGPPAVSSRPTFGAGNVACPHDPMCRTIGACTERILRETREARERKSG